jgi:Spy/CpxP family protein refolding chaperone
MTNKISKLFLVVSVILATLTFANAQNQPKPQNGQEPPKCNHDMKPGQPGSCPKAFFGIQDLSPEQKTKIDDLKLLHMKEVTPLRNQLNEKQARINTLMAAENADMGAINSSIDDFNAITNQLLKKKAEFKLAIRNVLTDKQKIIYNSKFDLFDDEGCCAEGFGKKGPDKCGPGGPGPKPEDHNIPEHK